MFTIVKNNSIVFSPRRWDQKQFNAGLDVAGASKFLKAQPAGPVDCGNGVWVLPVTRTSPSETPLDKRIVGHDYEISEDGKSVNQFWISVDVALEDYKGAYLTQLEDFRWRVETSGVTLPDGTVIATDRTSQAMINQAFTKLSLDYEELVESGVSESDAATQASTRFKSKSGWVDITYTGIKDMVRVAGKFVQDCFQREGQIADLIEACTTHEEVKDTYATEIYTGWPKDVSVGFFA